MNISIRFSILAVLVVLLVFTAAVITGTNYVTINQILLKSARNTIKQASNRINHQINNYLLPLNDRIRMGELLIKKNVITPEYSTRFINYLTGIVAGTKNISSAYWGGENGNLYVVKKDKGAYLNENVIHVGNKVKTISNVYNKVGRLLSASESDIAPFDPRFRPWYQQAKYRREHVWFVYPIRTPGIKEVRLGITSSTPVYGKDGKLRGVLAVDMPLKTIADYANQLQITDHSNIFICDNRKNLMTSSSAEPSKTAGYRMPKISDIKNKWAVASFDLHEKNNKSIFTYSFDYKKYIASYESIPNLTGNKWYVAIVTPISDIICPLKESLIISIFIVLGVIILSMLIDVFAANSISKPIVQLAEEAERVRKLELADVKYIKSRIREIVYMQKAFYAMKNGLKSFQRYIPSFLVMRLVNNEMVAEVGGSTKELTFLFIDVESFTALSERIAPEWLMQYLSEYLDAMSKVIVDLNGTVDKYIGDAIMAFWGAPIDDEEHAMHACQCALQMRQALEVLNDNWRKSGKPQINVRIGINTGPAIVGNIGSVERLNYTAIGDSVNIASRLEGINKVYSTRIAISENTYSLLQDKFICRLLDNVAVKGKAEKLYVYELIAEATSESREYWGKYNDDFNVAFNEYLKGNWQPALDLFNGLDKQYPNDQLLALYIDRCTKFIANPPKDWNGVWVMRTK